MSSEKNKNAAPICPHGVCEEPGSRFCRHDDACSGTSSRNFWQSCSDSCQKQEHSHSLPFLLLGQSSGLAIGSGHLPFVASCLPPLLLFFSYFPCFPRMSQFSSYPVPPQQQGWLNDNLFLQNSVSEPCLVNDIVSASTGISTPQQGHLQGPEDGDNVTRYEKRKAQNRISQQQFRKRKEQYVKELEDRVKELEEQLVNETKHLKEENAQLKEKVQTMETEIHTLRGAETAFRVAIEKIQASGTPVAVDTIMPHSPAHSPLHQQQLQRQQTPSHTTTSGSSATGLSPYQDTAMFEDLPSSSSVTAASRSSPASSAHHSHVYQLISHEEEAAASPDAALADDQPRFEHNINPRIAAGEATLTMEQVWERIQEHPNIEDVDMDSLCAQFKAQAVCSGTGPVVFERDFEQTMAAIISPSAMDYS
ncbi:hypothetical protein BC940DRAFT_299448 [Gongronella butleri]|nr:hypothetical protein BC940DRAFT_299448 [Gongronella butleri]